MKGVQCYELFGGIALQNHTFLFFINKTKCTDIFRAIHLKSHNILSMFCKMLQENGLNSSEFLRENFFN